MIPLKSKDIVERFIKSGEEVDIVDPSKTGRSRISVYNALLSYVKRNENLGVSVRFVNGEITLVNNEKHDTAIHN
jgi:hypothetical protein